MLNETLKKKQKLKLQWKNSEKNEKWQENKKIV